jgi:hypothetical protein
MTIVSSGAISIQDVYNEFGPSAVAGSTFASTPHGLDEFYSLGNKTSYFSGRAVTSTPNSGEISLNNFYGKSRDLQFNVIGDKSNGVDGYPASFTFTTGSLTGNQVKTLGFVPGGNLNRWYIVFLSRYEGVNQPNVTMSFDGGAAVGANHTATGTYVQDNKDGSTIQPLNSRISIWLYKKNAGSTLTISTNNNQRYQMGVFEVYTTHDMSASKRTFYTTVAVGTASITVPAAVGGLFIQSSTNGENSGGSAFTGEWLNLTAANSTNSFVGTSYEEAVVVRSGALLRAGTYVFIGGTFFSVSGTKTFSIRDDDGRTEARTNVSAGMYIAP